jgi:hypothetical protein
MGTLEARVNKVAHKARTLEAASKLWNLEISKTKLCNLGISQTKLWNLGILHPRVQSWNLANLKRNFETSEISKSQNERNF